MMVCDSVAETVYLVYDAQSETVYPSVKGIQSTGSDSQGGKPTRQPCVGWVGMPSCDEELEGHSDQVRLITQAVRTAGYGSPCRNGEGSFRDIIQGNESKES